ncbi:MAG TPA: RtcB family protein [Thermoflexia bacterium]|nr:RtcB family protein [Thermoflexia bacterium]
MADRVVAVVAHSDLPPDPQSLQMLERLNRSGLLACPPVALPDLHIKPALETPSSTATATRDTLILGLTSPSPNCGMSLARMSLCADDADDAALDALFSELARRLSPERRAPVLSPDQTADVVLRGAEAAVERYDLASSTLDYMDQRGNALPSDVDAQAVLRAVPRALLEIGGWKFAQVGRGNHFLELQVVDEIHDGTVARAWGLAEGQLVVMYHADSGLLGAFVGRLYAHRRKNTWRGRLYEWRIKLPFQLRVGPPSRIPQRINYHIAPHRLMPIPADSEEGRRTLLALQAAGNYAYANRLAVLAALRDAMRSVWGNNIAPPALLWDAPHNGIRREIIDDRKLWVHRHNAVRVEPPSQTPPHSPFAQTGQPVLLPGTERTSSYLCVAGDGAANTLHSADHGAGRSALRLGRPLNNGAATRLYTYRNALTEMVPHLSDDGVDAVAQVLRACDIARPVARLRPLSVLKGQG